MWAVKVKDRNMYVGVCAIPHHPSGLTVSRFPGNETYWPRKFSTEEDAKKVADWATKIEAPTTGWSWEVVPFPVEKAAC